VADDLGELDASAQEAIRAAAAELDASIESPELWTRLGRLYQAHRRFQPARTCYEQRLARDPGDPKTWYALALALDQLADPEGALRALARTRELDPAYAPARWRAGRLLLGLGRLEEAEAEFAAALDLAPEDAAATVGLARVRLQEQRPDEAVELLEAYTERQPDDANARYLLGTAYRAAGRMEEAARALAAGQGGDPVQRDPWDDEILALRTGARTDFLQAVGLIGEGRVDEGIERLEALRADAPDDPLILINLHRAYRMRGELDRAIDLLIEARRLDPMDDMVHLHLAGAFRDKAHQAGDPPDRALLMLALESATQVCELSPTYANAHGLRGDVLADLGRTDEATAEFEQAARLDPGSAMWQSKAGAALARANRWADALVVLRRLDALQPDQPRTLLVLAAALANTGRVDEAREPMERAGRLGKDDPTVLAALADLEQAIRSAEESAGAEGDEGAGEVPE